MKRLIKTIVTSETYQQSSDRSDPTDPTNLLLSRGPRFRLPAWMIRDAALASSGLLNPALGGPPVRPHEPEGVWEEIFMGRFTSEPSQGEAQYRRTLYAFWRRSIAPTFLFDSAQRRVCEVAMTRTNTPLQALTLLNDQTIMEASPVGTGLESERRQFDRLLQSLPEGTVVVADAGFISYALCRSLMGSGHSFVFRVAGNMRLVEGLSSSCTEIPQTTGCDLTCLWPKEESEEQPVLLRRITIGNQSGYPVVLVTNILDPGTLPDTEVMQIYRHRWELELYYRTFKQTWKFATLRSRTPETAYHEQRWRFVAC